MTSDPLIHLDRVSVSYMKRRSRAAVRSGLLHLVLGKRSEPYAALSDVSFELARGDALGVIGSNGAGKSTLCRVLTDVLAPDAGRITRRGRMSPAVSPAFGYEPLLSGRDNVRLMGVLSGLSRKDIDARASEIIAFAELDDVIDGPMRTYSTGMRSRLAFAVATHIDPDVLVLDEILGASDARFVLRAHARLRLLRERGCALVIVSHATKNVVELCSRGLWLEKGAVRALGPAADIVNDYERWQAASVSP